MKEKVAWSIFLLTGALSTLFGFTWYFVAFLAVAAIAQGVYHRIPKWYLRISGIVVFPSFLLGGLFFLSAGTNNCISIPSLSCLADWSYPALYGLDSKFVLEGPVTYSMSTSLAGIVSGVGESIGLGAWVGILELPAVPGFVVLASFLYPLLTKTKDWMIGAVSVGTPKVIIEGGDAVARPKSLIGRLGAFGEFGRLYAWTVVLVFLSPLYFAQLSNFNQVLSYVLITVPVFTAAGSLAEHTRLSFRRGEITKRLGSLIFSALAGTIGLLTILQVISGIPQSVTSTYLDESFAIYFLCIGVSITLFYFRPVLSVLVKKSLTLKSHKTTETVQGALVVLSIVYLMVLVSNLGILEGWSNMLSSVILGLGLVGLLTVSFILAKGAERSTKPQSPQVATTS